MNNTGDITVLKKLFKVLLVLICIIFVLEVIRLITGKTNLNKMSFPTSSLVTILVILTLLSPVIIRFIKNLFNEFRVIYRTYFKINIEYREFIKIVNNIIIINPEIFNDELIYLRETYKDENIVKKIVERQFEKNDSTDIIINMFGLPEIIEYSVFYFTRKMVFKYFPYYRKRGLYNILKIKYFFEFTFVNEHLSSWKDDRTKIQSDFLTE